jgi:hypothetical protein
MIWKREEVERKGKKLEINEVRKEQARLTGKEKDEAKSKDKGGKEE